jgi:hypothetical protein
MPFRHEAPGSPGCFRFRRPAPLSFRSGYHSGLSSSQPVGRLSISSMASTSLPIA